jgi:hypothetical protein
VDLLFNEGDRALEVLLHRPEAPSVLSPLPCGSPT